MVLRVRERRKIIELYDRGYTVPEIANSVGKPSHVVTRVLMEESDLPERIVQMYETGMSIDEIADKLCISSRCVEDKLREYGIFRMDEDRIKDLYYRGLKVSEIAKKVKKPVRSVLSILMNKTDLPSKVVSMHRRGFSLSRIARELGISVTSVARWINKISYQLELEEEE